MISFRPRATFLLALYLCINYLLSECSRLGEDWYPDDRSGASGSLRAPRTCGESVRCRGNGGGTTVHNTKVNSRLSEQFAAACERANDPAARESRWLVRRADADTCSSRTPDTSADLFRRSGSAWWIRNRARERRQSPQGRKEAKESEEEKRVADPRRTSDKRARRRATMRCVGSPAESTMNPEHREAEPSHRAWSSARTQLTRVSTRRYRIQRDDINETCKMYLK